MAYTPGSAPLNEANSPPSDVPRHVYDPDNAPPFGQVYPSAALGPCENGVQNGAAWAPPATSAPIVLPLKERPHEWSGSLRRHNYIDFVLYAVFLILFCSVELYDIGHKSYDAYRLAQTVQQGLLMQDTPEPQLTWGQFNELNGVMHWLRTQFYVIMWAFDPNADLNDDIGIPDPPPQHAAGMLYNSSMFLGSIRLRQLRVKAGSCTVSEFWREYFAQWPGAVCNAPYNTNTRPYLGYDLDQAWPGLDMTDLSNFTADGDAPVNLTQAFIYVPDTHAGHYRGVLPTHFHYYGPEGYVADIPSNGPNVSVVARDWLEGLRAKGWLDGQTRALFIEFTLYLPLQDIALPTRLVVEVHPVGTLVLGTSLEALVLHPYTSANNWQLWFRVLLVLSVCVNSVFEVYSMYHLRGYYARRNSATWVWILAGVLVYVSVITELILYVIAIRQLESLEYDPNKYFALHKVAYLITVRRSIVAFTSFIVWFRLLKYTSQMPTIGLLGRTIGKVLPRVAAFFLMSAVIFLAFAQTFYMVYNPTVPGFQSYGQSFMSVLRFSVGDFSYNALATEAPLLTPFLFSLLLIIVFFIWVNLVIAIISTVYEAERDLADGFQWDAAFEGTVNNPEHPEHDAAALAEHPVTVPGLTPDALTPRIALRPDGHTRFKRFRIASLKHFDKESLITVDMEMVKSDDKGDTIDLAGHATNLLTAAQHVSSNRGVYARLGVVRSGGGSLLRPSHSEGARAARRTTAYDHTLQLQALYFSLDYHNLSTAQIWWKENRHNFDEREKFLHDISVITRYARLPSAFRRSSSSPQARSSMHRGSSGAPAATLGHWSCVAASLNVSGGEPDRRSQPRRTLSGHIIAMGSVVQNAWVSLMKSVQRRQSVADESQG